MLTELNPLAAPSPVRVVSATTLELRPQIAAGTAASRAVAADPLTRQAIEPSQLLDRVSRAAARAIFADRDIEITSYRDEGTGRTVYRVADRTSGEVLHQSPPDALLRFFASARAALDQPLMAVEA